MTAMAPVGFTDEFPFRDRLMDWLRWGATLRRLTLAEVTFVEYVLAEERRLLVGEELRRQDLVRALLCRPPVSEMSQPATFIGPADVELEERVAARLRRSA